MFSCRTPEPENNTPPTLCDFNPNELVCFDLFDQHIRNKISKIINFPNFYRDLLFYSLGNAINISIVKRLILKYLSNVTPDDANAISDWLKSPFYSVPKDKSKKDELGKQAYDAYLNTNLRMIIAKELNCFDFEKMIDSLELSIHMSDQLDMAHVIFFFLIFSNVDPVERCEMLFNIFDYDSTGKLVTGKSIFYRLFRKLVLICLFTSDILLNDFITMCDYNKVIEYNKRIFSCDSNENNVTEDINDEEYIYFKTYTDIVFEYKKFLFFLRHSHNVMKECVTFISHSLIFFQNKTNPEIDKSEFLKIMKESNYDILNPRAYRLLFVQFLFHNVKKSRLFITEFSNLIRSFERKVEEKSTEMIRTSGEEYIKEQNLKKDYDKYISILENHIQCFQNIMHGEKYLSQKEKEEMTKQSIKSTGKRKDIKMNNTLSFKLKIVNPETPTACSPFHASTIQPNSSTDLGKFCTNSKVNLEIGAEKNQPSALKSKPPSEKISEKDEQEQEQEQEQDAGYILEKKTPSKGGFVFAFKKSSKPLDGEVNNEDKLKEKEYFNTFLQPSQSEVIATNKDSPIILGGKGKRQKDSHISERNLTILKTISHQIPKNLGSKLLTAPIKVHENENFEDKRKDMIITKEKDDKNKKNNHLIIEESLEDSFSARKKSVKEKEHVMTSKAKPPEMVNEKKDNNKNEMYEDESEYSKIPDYTFDIIDFQQNEAKDSPKAKNKNKNPEIKIKDNPSEEERDKINEISVKSEPMNNALHHNKIFSTESENEFDAHLIQKKPAADQKIIQVDKPKNIEEFSKIENEQSIVSEGQFSDFMSMEKGRLDNNQNKSFSSLLGEEKPEKCRMTNPLLKFSHDVIPEDHEENRPSNFECGNLVAKMSNPFNNICVAIAEDELLWNYFSTVDILKPDLNISQMKSKIVMLDTNKIKKTAIGGKRLFTKQFDPQQLMNILESRYDENMIDLYMWVMHHYNSYLVQKREIMTKVKFVDTNFFSLIEKCFGNSNNYDTVMMEYKDYIYENSSLIFHNPEIIFVVPIYIEIPTKKDKKLILAKFNVKERMIVFYDSSDSIVEIESIRKINLHNK